MECNTKYPFQQISISGRTRKGYTHTFETKPNQDSILMLHHTTTDTFIVACFDGHGQFGHHVSRFCYMYLSGAFFSHPEFETNLPKAVEETINQLAVALRADAAVNTIWSGSTLILLALRGTQLVSANIGDSRAVMGFRSRGAPVVKRLSLDHKPDIKGEQQRIVSKGGRVLVELNERGETMGPARVYLAQEFIPGLAMSRSLGDDAVHMVGVSSEPSIAVIDLSIVPADEPINGEPKFILMIGTDGVFDVCGNDKCIDIAFQNRGKPEKIVDHILISTHQMWLSQYGLADDTSIGVISIF